MEEVKRIEIKVDKQPQNKVIAKEYVESNFIEKYKVIKLKGKIHQLLDNTAIIRGYQLIIDGYFNELLEDK